jgi:hypothetical protein
LPDVTLAYAIGLFGILVITAVLASWMGLLISSLAPTQKTALTVVPLVIIPQLLFGGLIRPIKDMSPSESFMLTDQEFTQLHQEIPAEILEQIQVLKNRQFVKEKHLRSEIRTLLGYTNAEQYSDVLLQYARLPVPQQKFALLPFHLHDLILQKWAFKALLLYNSLGEPNVLQKQLNFDRYREYEYVQFEAIHYLDLFFQDEGAQTATQKKVLLYQTLGGLVLIHALLLLVPNYYWLRRKLQY